MKQKKTAGSLAADIVNFLILTAFSFICFYPFYYLLMYALSDQNQAVRGISFWPRGFTLENFARVLSQQNILHATLISLSRTVVGTAVTVVCTSFFAFLLSQQQLPGRKIIYRIVIASMYFSSGLIPWFVTMSAYGLQNSFMLYILPTAVVVFFLVLCKTYMEQLPPALVEAALVDGAGPIYIFTRVIFPLCRPVIATIAIFAAVDQWNMWRDNFYLVNSSNLQTLQLTLLNYLTKAEMISSMSMAGRMGASQVRLSATTVRMSISFVVALPILLVYPIFQRHFVKGILVGAVKG